MRVNGELARVAYRGYGPACELWSSKEKELLAESGAGTGKTRSILQWAKDAMERHPGVRGVFSRLTKKSMRDTVLPEWEDVVLGRQHPAIHGTASRMTREAYFHPNGSEIILHELQNPDRFLSAQYDFFIIFQGEEIPNDEVYQKALTRLRNGVLKHPRAILDVNPGVESHWINVRANIRLCRACYSGQDREAPAVIEIDDETGECPACHGTLWRPQMQRLHYRHHHNPRWFDHEKQEWTPEGKEYVFITLGSLRGVQRERLLKHRWVAEEGIIMEEWDPNIHYGGGKLYAPETDPTEDDCPLWRFHMPDGEIYTFEWIGAGVDWGHTDPGVIQVWGVTDAHEYVLIEEHVKCKKLIEYWAQLADALRVKYDIRFFACDPSRPDYIEAFNKRFSGSFEREGPCYAVAADNSLRAKPKTKAKDLVGVDLMREVLVDNEGVNRAYVWADSPQRIDRDRRKAGLPVCFKDEILQWTWAKNADGKIIEKPDPEAEDHSMDAWRYFLSVAWLRRFKDSTRGRKFRVGSIGQVLGWQERLNRRRA